MLTLKMRFTWRGFPGLAILLPGAAVPSFAQSAEEARVRDATTVFREIMAAPDAGVPKSILDNAERLGSREVVDKMTLRSGLPEAVGELRSVLAEFAGAAR